MFTFILSYLSYSGTVTNGERNQFTQPDLGGEGGGHPRSVTNPLTTTKILKIYKYRFKYINIINMVVSVFISIPLASNFQLLLCLWIIIIYFLNRFKYIKKFTWQHARQLRSGRKLTIDNFPGRKPSMVHVLKMDPPSGFAPRPPIAHSFFSPKTGLI